MVILLVAGWLVGCSRLEKETKEAVDDSWKVVVLYQEVLVLPRNTSLFVCMAKLGIKLITQSTTKRMTTTTRLLHWMTAAAA